MTVIEKNSYFETWQEALEELNTSNIWYYNTSDFSDSKNLLSFYEWTTKTTHYLDITNFSNPFYLDELTSTLGGYTYLEYDCLNFTFLQEISTDPYPTTSLQDIKINIKTNYVKSLDLIYPIGSVYISRENFHPASLFGGNWEQIIDKFPYYNAATELSYNGNNTSNIVPYHNHANFSFRHNHNLTANTSFFPVITNAGIGEHKLGTPGISTWIRPTFARVTNNNTDVAKSSVSSTVTATVPVTIGPAGNAIVENNNMPPYVTFYAWRRIS